jgi:flagellar biosynthesis activator protein FlaF
MSINAYRAIQKTAESPRAMERRLISEITGEMIAAQNAGFRGAALMESLHRNREMWNAFSDACLASGNGLPAGLRASIVSIGMWVGRYTSEVATGKGDMQDLIDVNKSIMEGLASMPQSAAA